MHDPNRARVLWNKGQNFFVSFFTELHSIRKAVGDDVVFARWCFDELRIPLSTINRVADVLTRVDAARVKADLHYARAAERHQKRIDRKERELMAAAEKKRKQEEKQRAQKERLAEKERKRKEKAAAEKRERKNARARMSRAAKRERDRIAMARAVVAEEQAGANIVPFVMKPVEEAENALAKRIKVLIARRATMREEWINISLELALLLNELRKDCKSDTAFNQCLDKHGIQLTHQDRAALLNLGMDMKFMRMTLDRSSSWSYREIWNDAKLQLAKN